MNVDKLKFVGRYIVKNDRYYIFNGGSGFSFKMKGKGFKVSFNSTSNDGYYYIIVDRDYDNKVKISYKSHTRKKKSLNHCDIFNSSYSSWLAV